MALEDYLKLSAKERALVAVAVLLDGIEAEIYLDSEGGNPAVKTQARWFATMPAELRMPLVGSLLRKALQEGI